jgi:hypothetical protein
MYRMLVPTVLEAGGAISRRTPDHTDVEDQPISHGGDGSDRPHTAGRMTGLPSRVVLAGLTGDDSSALTHRASSQC